MRKQFREKIDALHERVDKAARQHVENSKDYHVPLYAGRCSALREGDRILGESPEWQFPLYYGDGITIWYHVSELHKTDPDLVKDVYTFLEKHREELTVN